jgi:hypothetical protein
MNILKRKEKKGERKMKKNNLEGEREKKNLI